jgi:phosphoesterase RecJ-like protein
MHYKESKHILQSIKAANRILLTSHKEPDADSAGSIIALHLGLKRLGIKTDLVCKDEVPKYLTFLPRYKQIRKVDFRSFNFRKYDLIITLDSSSWGQVVGSELKENVPNLPIVVIDHHSSNKGYGKINLIDKSATSVSEMIYKILIDWSVEIDSGIANNLLTGITGDTGSFRFPFINAETFEAAAALMKAGADRDKIIYNLYFSVDLAELKYLSEVLKAATVDKKDKIVWAAIPYKKYLKLGGPEGSGFAGAYFQVVKGTKIGILMIETESQKLEVSFRARENIDVSKISVLLGGGGHKKAAGVAIYGMKFEDAVEKVLETARKYAKNA